MTKMKKAVNPINHIINHNSRIEEDHKEKESVPKDIPNTYNYMKKPKKNPLKNNN